MAYEELRDTGRPMRAPAWLLLLVLPAVLSPLAAGQPATAPLLITGFAVDLPGAEADDAVEVTNVGAQAVDLAHWTLSDGEGMISWPSGTALAAGGSITVAGNATAWLEAGGPMPDFSILDHPDIPQVGQDGPFLLARDGDAITLSRNGSLVDVVVYGDAEAAPGWAGPAVDLVGSPFLRWYGRTGTDGPLADTDSAADWHRPKREYVGASDHPSPAIAVAGGLLAYVAPDESRAVVRALLATANHSVRMNVYELLDTQIAEDLAAKAAAGVDVRVLLDESPVGMEPWERRARDGLAAALVADGAHVHLSTHERFAFNHAKYILVDGVRTLVQTENVVPSGVPVDVDHGNRGWGIVVDDPTLGTYIAAVFDEDFAVGPYGATAWRPPAGGTDPPPLQPTIPAGTVDHPSRHIAAHATVRPVLSPDHTAGRQDPLVAAISAARHEVRVVHLNLPPHWRDPAGATWPNPYLEALAEAAERGVRVRVLLDGHFVEDADDNEDTVAWIEGHGRDNFEARLWGPGRGGVLHAKGFVIDGETVFLGSMNGNLNSVARNREVGLLVGSTEAAGFFSDVFDSDWEAAGPAPVLAVASPSAAIAIGTVIMAAHLLAASATRGRV